jgi:hypothetical protein
MTPRPSTKRRLIAIVVTAAVGVLGLWIAIPLATIVFEFAGFILFAGVLLLLGFGTPETADRYDGLNFHSVDLTPVAVTLLRRENDPDPSHFATLHIPRAAISFFSLDYATVGHPVQKKGLKRVPDNVEADNLSLAQAYPGGQPFSIRAADYARANHTTPSMAASTTELRQEEMQIKLTYISPEWPW